MEKYRTCPNCHVVIAGSILRWHLRVECCSKHEEDRDVAASVIGFAESQDFKPDGHRSTFDQTAEGSMT